LPGPVGVGFRAARPSDRFGPSGPSDRFRPSERFRTFGPSDLSGRRIRGPSRAFGYAGSSAARASALSTGRTSFRRPSGPPRRRLDSVTPAEARGTPPGRRHATGSGAEIASRTSTECDKALSTSRLCRAPPGRDRLSHPGRLLMARIRVCGVVGSTADMSRHPSRGQRGAEVSTDRARQVMP
jgi:hypothetical protein